MKKTFKYLLDILKVVVVGVIAGFLVVNFLVCMVKVEGVSMEPTYYDGNILLVNRLDNPDRGDIVTFKSQNRNLIKRIIGVPGDIVKIENSIVYVNGKPLEEEYIKEPTFDSGNASSEIKLAEDEYFVLGDNRNNSIDSRVFGVIYEKDIIGTKLIDLQ